MHNLHGDLVEDVQMERTHGFKDALFVDYIFLCDNLLVGVLKRNPKFHHQGWISIACSRHDWNFTILSHICNFFMHSHLHDSNYLIW